MTAILTATFILSVLTAFSCGVLYSSFATAISADDIRIAYSGLPNSLARHWIREVRHLGLEQQAAGDYGAALLLQLLHIPRLLLAVALLLFLAGLCLLWLFLWTMPQGGSNEKAAADSRNVLITLTQP